MGSRSARAPARSTAPMFLLEMTPPGSGTAGPGAAENMLAALSFRRAAPWRSSPIRTGCAFWRASASAATREHLARQLHAQYPQCALRMIDDGGRRPHAGGAGRGGQRARTALA